MLLSCDRYRCDLSGVAGLVEGSRHGHLPGNGVALTCSPVALDIVARSPRGHDAAIIEVHHEDLGRLRGTINSRNERHDKSFPDVLQGRRR